jgi:hypothetical protein
VDLTNLNLSLTLLTPIEKSHDLFLATLREVNSRTLQCYSKLYPSICGKKERLFYHVVCITIHSIAFRCTYVTGFTKSFVACERWRQRLELNIQWQVRVVLTGLSSFQSRPQVVLYIDLGYNTAQLRLKREL